MIKLVLLIILSQAFAGEPPRQECASSLNSLPPQPDSRAEESWRLNEARSSQGAYLWLRFLGLNELTLANAPTSRPALELEREALYRWLGWVRHSFSPERLIDLSPDGGLSGLFVFSQFDPRPRHYLALDSSREILAVTLNALRKDFAAFRVRGMKRDLSSQSGEFEMDWKLRDVLGTDQTSRLGRDPNLFLFLRDHLSWEKDPLLFLQNVKKLMSPGDRLVVGVNLAPVQDGISPSLWEVFQSLVSRQYPQEGLRVEKKGERGEGGLSFYAGKHHLATKRFFQLEELEELIAQSGLLRLRVIRHQATLLLELGR